MVEHEDREISVEEALRLRRPRECEQVVHEAALQRRIAAQLGIDICDCGRELPHQGRCDWDSVIPRRKPFVW